MEKADIEVEITSNINGLEVDIDRLIEHARTVCSRFSNEKTSISIAIVGDKAIKKINEDFLQQTSKTDVISFDLSDDLDDISSFEVVVNAEKAAREAQNRGHSTEKELALYVTHGLLHQLGFDDLDEKDAEKMHNMEDELLQEAGFGIIYGNEI